MTRPSLRSGLFGAAALISGLTLLSRLTGFIRVAVFSSTVGATEIGSVYQTVNSLPNVVFEVAVGGALAGAVVPVLARPLARRMHDVSNQIASALLTWTLTILTPLALVLAIAAGPLSHLLLPDDDSAALGARLLVVFAPQVVLYGVSVVLSGVLQAGKRFAWPALVPLLSSLVVIGAYAGFAHATAGHLVDSATLAADAVTWLGWGTTAGVVALSLPLFIPVLRSGIRVRWTYRFPDGVGRRVLSLALAGIGAVAAQQLSVVVVIYLANHDGGPGTLPTYTYIQACYMLPYAVLAWPLATSAFPRMAELADSGDRAGFARLTAATGRAVLAAAAAGVVALMAAAPAVESVFVHLDRGVVSGLGNALTVFAPGILGLSLVALATRALYSLNHGRLAGIVGSSGWVGVAILSWVAVNLTVGVDYNPPRTLLALGWGMCAAQCIAAVVAVGGLIKAAGASVIKGSGRTLVALTVGAVPGVLVGRAVEQWLSGPSVWTAVAGAVGGAAVAVAFLGAAIWVGDRGLVTHLLSASHSTLAP